MVGDGGGDDEAIGKAHAAERFFAPLPSAALAPDLEIIPAIPGCFVLTARAGRHCDVSREREGMDAKPDAEEASFFTEPGVLVRSPQKQTHQTGRFETRCTARNPDFFGIST